MKLKSLPEDFQVEELSEFLPDGGPYAAYRLTKRGLGTPEVVAAIARRWKIDRRHISVGGLKDRHALTTQWITIYHARDGIWSRPAFGWPTRGRPRGRSARKTSGPIGS